jgi:hypothetical protein
VQADFAVELGADDETLEMPWAAERGGPRYYDVKRHPELLVEVVEAQRSQEMRQFLCAVNAPAGALETAKCDFWSSTEINPEEEIFAPRTSLAPTLIFFFPTPVPAFHLLSTSNWQKC